MLTWAQRILADEDALEQELSEMRIGLSGDLRFGIIPAAMPVAPLITNPFSRTHPLVTLRLLMHSSIEIQRGLDEGTLEAGLTYLDNEPLRNVRMLPLYRERYMLLTPTGGPFDGRRSANWREAAALPLCLLTRDMQNRRIIDGLFAEGGAPKPKVAIETNSVVALMAHVRSGPMVERHPAHLSGPARPQGDGAGWLQRGGPGRTRGVAVGRPGGAANAIRCPRSRARS